MIEWILILTIIAGGGYGSSIAVVPEFQSQHECQVAGRTWMHNHPEGAAVEAVCIQRTEPAAVSPLPQEGCVPLPPFPPDSTLVSHP